MFPSVKHYLGTLFFVAMSLTAKSLLLDGVQSTTNEDLSLLVAKMEAEIVDLKNEMSGVKQDLADVQGRCSTCTAKAAFMAALSSGITGCDTDEPITFDNVLVNVGNGYDNRHGVFRAPRSGIYHLSLTVSVVPNAHVHVKMVKNSVNNEIGYVHQETEDHWQMSSTSVLVQLSAGDDVWCKCTELSSTVSGGNTYHSHFSGYFVTAT